MLSMCLWNAQQRWLMAPLESFESPRMIGFPLALFRIVQFISNALVGARGGRYGTGRSNGYSYFAIQIQGATQLAPIFLRSHYSYRVKSLAGSGLYVD
jgi:hypothetical protein